MADPSDPYAVDPFAPQDPYAVDPWSWVPDEWKVTPYGMPELPVEHAPVEHATTEIPSFGVRLPDVPLGAPEVPLEAPSQAPDEIEMPPDYVGQGSTLQPGIPVPSEALDAAAAAPPTDPDAIEMPPEDVGVNARAFEESKDPLAVANRRLDLEEARADYARQRQTRLLDEDIRAATENRRILRESQQATRQQMAEIDRDYKALAEQKVGWASKSGFQKVIGAIVGIIGGLYQGATGSARNIGIDAIDRIIEGEVGEHRLKMADLQARRKDVAGRLGQQFEDFATEEKLRQSMYEMTARKIEADAAGLDPKGSQFQKRIETAMEVRQRAAAARAKFEEDDWKRRLDLSKHALDYEKHLEDVRKAKAAEGARLGGGVGTGKELVTPAEAKARFDIDIAQPMSQKEVNLRLEGKQKALEIAKGANTTGLSKEQLDRVIPGLEAEVTLPDGTTATQPFYAVGQEAEGQKLRNTVTSTKQLVRLMDEVLRIRTGWTSDTVKSAEWQKLQTNWASAIGKAKGEGMLHLGVLTGPDMGLIGKYLGAADPTRFIGIEAGVLKARENLINDVNDAAQGLAPPGVRVKLFGIPRIKPAPPNLDADDQAYQKAKGREAYDQEAMAGLYAGGRQLHGQAEFDERRRVTRETVDRETELYLSALAANAVSPDEKARAKAVDRIVELAGRSETPSVRRRARELLTNLREPDDIPSDVVGGGD